MESWSAIINTSMIGTDKKAIDAGELPADLSAAAALILSNEKTDKEEKFLQTAALVFNYRQCGVTPIVKEQVSLSKALPEENPYCSNLSMQVLKDVFAEDSIPLLKLWLQHCHKAQQVVQPEIIPSLLAAAIQYKNLQTPVTRCCGKRGEWLSGINDAWNFSVNQTTETLWQTGTPEQRKSILKETRSTDPATARQWMIQTWPTEDAATKLSFLEIFSSKISEEDIAFLESLSTEKSKKIKDEALLLLKQIPGSAIVQQYMQILKAAVVLKKEKALLGFTSKMLLQFQLPATIEETIFKTGIEKLSSTKDFSDEAFIIFQLMQSVPPSFWEQQFDSKPEQIIQLLQKDTVGKKMLPAIIIAIKKFEDIKWAIAFMQYSEVFYLDIIPLIPQEQQEYYSNRFFDSYPDSIIQYAISREQEWSFDLSKKIFRYTANQAYQYNRSFYNQHIHLIPGKIALELERLTPTEIHMQAQWSNTSEYILKLLHLKEQIIQSFK